jgi:hypothetical protein
MRSRVDLSVSKKNGPILMFTDATPKKKRRESQLLSAKEPKLITTISRFDRFLLQVVIDYLTNIILMTPFVNAGFERLYYEM